MSMLASTWQSCRAPTQITLIPMTVLSAMETTGMLLAFFSLYYDEDEDEDDKMVVVVVAVDRMGHVLSQQALF